MTNRKKTAGRILGAVFICFIMWRVSLCLGIVRTIPREWVDYRNGYTRNSDPGIMPDGDVRCPLCLGHVAALYGGIAEDYRRDGLRTRAGDPVWRWEGCVLDAFWECDRCGKKFNADGKAILRLPDMLKRLLHGEDY